MSEAKKRRGKKKKDAGEEGLQRDDIPAPPPLQAPATAAAAAPSPKKQSRPAAAADSSLPPIPAFAPLGRVGRGLRATVYALMGVVSMILIMHCMYRAYSIRLYAVKDYGRVIHEFDPWFNFRATEYLHRNGWTKFFQWFDHESWYPLGRPVGTTIYPGMQIIAVTIHGGMQMLPKYKVPKVLFNDTGLAPITGPIADMIGEDALGASAFVRGLGGPIKMPANLRMNFPMSLNDICVFMPAWFGAIASLALGMLTWEATGSRSAGVAATYTMSIIPAHIMRSVAGGYDNESVAVTAICLTFWLWIRSVRTPSSWPYGVLAGLAYVYMVAAWGGYIFVINMVGAHAALLVALGRYHTSLYRAYTLFFVIGTAGATRVPVVGWLPLKSMEQVAPLLVFLVFQVLELCDECRRRTKMKAPQFVVFRIAVFAAAVAAAAAVASAMMDAGVVSPFTSRIRALFIKHQKTGNPLVDSVAEHQAASPEAFQHYLHHTYHILPWGFAICLLLRTSGAWFLVLYAAVAYHFALKMSRLIIICGPVASALTGVAIGYTVDFCVEQLLSVLYRPEIAAEGAPGLPPRSGGVGTVYSVVLWLPRKVAAKVLGAAHRVRANRVVMLVEIVLRAAAAVMILYTVFVTGPPACTPRKTWPCLNVPELQVMPKATLPALRGVLPDAVGPTLSAVLPTDGVTTPKTKMHLMGMDFRQEKMKEFEQHCEQLARSMSHPQLMFKTRDGRIIDDYRKAYHWIRDNTPADSRVMAWWDYGYQIAGIANRTSIADGNTWNHEHIATLGRMLTSPEDVAHRMIRHLADYVLVWAGDQGDDLGKSPHLARIGNSVYPEHCGDDDPTCSKFGFHNYDRNKPTKMMAKSLLYKLHSGGIRSGVHVNPKLFREVHSSEHGLVRVYKVQEVNQASKKWIADMDNKQCDAPGSWYCPGDYPPKFKKFMKDKRDFSQLEDFNKKGGGTESAYTKMIKERQRKGQAEGV